MKCSNCGAECKTGKFCPDCGAKLVEDVLEINGGGNTDKVDERKSENKKPIYKKWWFWVIVILFAVMLYSFMSKGDSNGAGAADVKEKDDVVKDDVVKKVADYSELIGMNEDELSGYGFNESEEYEFGYGMLEGAVEAGCDEGKVVLLRVLEAEGGEIPLYGIKIGMPETEAGQKLSELYPENVNDGNVKMFINFKSKSGVGYTVEEGMVSAIAYTSFSDEVAQYYQNLIEEESRAQYIFPDSDKKYLTEDEIRRVEADMLVLGRNEIFARHGRMFNDAEIAAYFASKLWYEGTVPADQFNAETVFNDFEKKNVELIKRIEDEINGPSEEEIAAQEARDFLVGNTFHLKEWQKVIIFESENTIRVNYGGEILDAYFNYSISARYGEYREGEYAYLVYLNIGGVEYYLRYFTSGDINLAGDGEFDGWYEML